MSTDAPNHPVYVSDTHTIIFRELCPEWPWYVIRRTDGRDALCADVVAAVMWAEQVESTKQLSTAARALVREWHGPQ